MTRIIDRDIEIYTAFVWTQEALLRRCVPRLESIYRERLDAARKALDALKQYRDVVDKSDEPNSLEP